MDKLPTTLRNRAAGSLWSIFTGDALSMPVHWFYNPADIKTTFGYIKEYHAAPAIHPSSIMNLHSTGDGGRGGQSGSIIGDVILKGKKEFWGKRNMHYHQGMKAGENTLNAHCARLLMRTITSQDIKKYDAPTFLTNYVTFMTTPGTHGDTYAESYHRIFFSNYSNGKPLEACGGVGHDTPSIGAFVTLPVVVVASLNDYEKMQADVKRHLFLTHPDEGLSKFVAVYAKVLYRLLQGDNAKEVLLEAAGSLGTPSPKMRLTDLGMDMNALLALNSDSSVVQRYGSACYITSSLPIVIYLAYKYADDYSTGLCQNTNLGGENCHRGAALGALLGAIAGRPAIPTHFIEGLSDSKAIEAEINGFLDAVALN